MESKKHKAQETKKNGGAKGPEEVDCSCDERNECSCEEAPQAGAGKGGGERGEPSEKAAPDYYGQMLALKADFENYRKRMEKERPEFVKFGKAEILLKLLPLYDMLLQAHLHVIKLQGGADEAGQAQDIIKGLEMIFKEFNKVFDSEGIRPMEVVGKPYDPMASEIIGIDEGDAQSDGRVTAEFQKGFYYGDKVLRPAKVKIAKAKAPEATENAEKEEKKDR